MLQLPSDSIPKFITLLGLFLFVGLASYYDRIDAKCSDAQAAVNTQKALKLNYEDELRKTGMLLDSASKAVAQDILGVKINRPPSKIEFAALSEATRRNAQINEWRERQKDFRTRLYAATEAEISTMENLNSLNHIETSGCQLY